MTFSPSILLSAVPPVRVTHCFQATLVCMGYSLGPVALGFANSFLGRRQVMFWFGIPVVLSYAAIGFSQDKVLIYLGNFMVGFLQSMPFGIVGKSVSFKRLHCHFPIHIFCSSQEHTSPRQFTRRKETPSTQFKSSWWDLVLCSPSSWDTS